MRLVKERHMFSMGQDIASKKALASGYIAPRIPTVSPSLHGSGKPYGFKDVAGDS